MLSNYQMYKFHLFVQVIRYFNENALITDEIIPVTMNNHSIIILWPIKFESLPA